MKLCIACGVYAAFSDPAYARAKSQAQDAIRAMVITDGAAVYSQPNFDAPVTTYLRYQTIVVASKKAYAGIGGLGLFHKIRFKGGKGYIADTDIRVTSAELKEVDPPKDTRSKAFTPEEKKTERREKKPLYFTRFLGAAVSRVKFTEKFSGRKLSEDMWMYGLRMSGPGTLFDGPPLDFNLWFSLDKPGYYSQFADGKPTGFLLFGDIMAQLPLVDYRNTLVTYGLGVMWTYTKYRVPVNDLHFDSQEFRLGVDLGLGVGQRIGKFMIRLDGKYYIEKTQYPGYILSVQAEY